MSFHLYLLPMIVILLIFIVGLAPAAISAVMTLRAERRTKSGEYPADVAAGTLTGMMSQDKDLQYIEGLGYMIGDITCLSNARSPYLRCAVNPMGPCDGCTLYEPKIFDRQY